MSTNAILGALAAALDERAADDKCSHVLSGAPRCDVAPDLEWRRWCIWCLARAAADVLRTVESGVTISGITPAASTELRSIIRAGVREALNGVDEAPSEERRSA